MKIKKMIFLNRGFYPDRSATSQILSDLAFYSAKNVNIVVICCHPLYRFNEVELSSHEEVQNVKIYRAYKPMFGKNNNFLRALDYFFMYVAFMFKLCQVSKVGDVVIVKSDPPLLSLFIFPVSCIKQLSQINWHQDLYPEIAIRLGVKLPRILYSILRKMRNYVGKMSEHNITIGGKMKGLLVNEGIPQELISIIPNWTDDKALKSIERSDNPLIKEWRLEGKFVACYSGNLGKVHDYLTILKAASSLGKNANIVFLFIGGGHYFDKLMKEVGDLCLEDLFIFKELQDRSQLIYSLSVADVHLISLLPEMEGLVLPSKFYGISAVARPSIFIGDIRGDLAETIKKYSCGICVEIGNDKHLAEVLMGFKTGKYDRFKMGSNARIMIDNIFNKQNSIEKWDKIVSRFL